MLKEILQEIFVRDLGNLVKEIELYPTDDALWRTAEGISNSGGNLCLHICGNLNHFVGAQLGGTGYVRQRDREFSDSGYTKENLVGKVKFTAAMVAETLAKLSEKDLEKAYPLEMFGKTMQTGFMLTHLTAHLNYHLGQINYHRRLC